MSKYDDVIPVCEQLRLGRLIFGGAAASELADRYALPIETMEQSWHFCQRALSEHFAASDENEFRLLSEEELRGRATESLRLLLDWRQSLLLSERSERFSI